jgi:hypothetical protein
MESVEQSLEALGLKDGAAWSDVTTAYKDLIRVWHPDRFQHDERLRKRAESQTQRLNAAMELLRKTFKDGDLPVRINRPKPQPRHSPPQPQRDYTHHTTLVPAPFVVHQRRLTSLYRIVATGCLGALGLLLYSVNEGMIPQRASFGCLVAVFAFHSLLRNAFLLVTGKPVIIVDRYGFSSSDCGSFSWPEIQRIWTFNQKQHQCLGIECSREYLKRQPIYIRSALALRKAIRRDHKTILCSGLDVHPNHIIRAVDLQYECGDVEHFPTVQPKKDLWIHLTTILGFTAAATPVVMLWLDLPINQLEILMCLGAFSLSRLAVLMGTALKAPKR